MNGYIYIIENLTNGKCYVGQTTQRAEGRIRKHLSGCASELVYNAVTKYGIENFATHIFETSVENLDDMECHYIQQLNSLAPSGYNLREGGAYGQHSEETKEKCSKANKGRFIGRSVSAEVRERISKTLTGRKHTSERRKRQSESHKGKKLSKSHRENIRKTLREQSNAWRNADMIRSDFAMGSNVSAISRKYKCSRQSVRNVLAEGN